MINLHAADKTFTAIPVLLLIYWMTKTWPTPNIVAVCSVLSLGNSEGEIIKQTIGPMLLYGAIAAVMSMLLL